MQTPHHITSISALHKLMGLKKPVHPLVSVVDFSTVGPIILEQAYTYDFYMISLKKNYQGKLKYGQQYYDFDEGMMTFIAPHQVLRVDKDDGAAPDGHMLVVHPDFLRAYPLSGKIKEYGFFSYAVNEALHLSESEEQLIQETMINIDREIKAAIDTFTQDVVVSQIDLLLTYCNRFYHRQFITRKSSNNDLLIRLETLLSNYLNNEEMSQTGPPSVQYVAAQLNLSPNYLSDMLRAYTGLGTKQHIQNKLIEKAKEILTTTNLSVSEIAYQLGFEYPQSFNKLFRSKTNLSPSEYRESFN